MSQCCTAPSGPQLTSFQLAGQDGMENYLAHFLALKEEKILKWHKGDSEVENLYFLLVLLYWLCSVFILIRLIIGLIYFFPSSEV